MRRARYQRRAGAFLIGPPIEVEVLALDHVHGVASIRQPIPADCIVNIARRARGLPNLEHEDRTVPLAHLELPPESLT